ncbi:MAG TPA: hypothetical protein VGO56_05840 [Pyrinomonadaceae bacterium]|nr:hypothetical protein [Pyrinomonadaceae bacterium]
MPKLTQASVTMKRLLLAGAPAYISSTIWSARPIAAFVVGGLAPRFN